MPLRKQYVWRGHSQGALRHEGCGRAVPVHPNGPSSLSRSEELHSSRRAGQDCPQ